MVARVRKVGDEFTAVIPPQIAEELGLVDGSELEIRPVIKPKPEIRLCRLMRRAAFSSAQFTEN